MGAADRCQVGEWRVSRRQLPIGRSGQPTSAIASPPDLPLEVASQARWQVTPPFPLLLHAIRWRPAGGGITLHGAISSRSADTFDLAEELHHVGRPRRAGAGDVLAAYLGGDSLRRPWRRHGKRGVRLECPRTPAGANEAAAPRRR